MWIGTARLADKVFLDSNILLRALIPQMERHQLCADLLIRLLRSATEVWVSGQVLREFLVRATHPRTLKRPLLTQTALNRLNLSTLGFYFAQETEVSHNILRELLTEYQIFSTSIHDANHVATMLAHGIDTLYTLDGGLVRFANRITVLNADGKAHTAPDSL